MGTCVAASGRAGKGELYTTKAACDAACNVCGDDQCFFESTNNVWIGNASCSDPDISTKEECVKEMSSMRCGLFSGSIGSSTTLSTDQDKYLNNVILTSTGEANANILFSSEFISSSGSGSGAEISIVISEKTVSSIKVTNAGSGYSVGDTLTLSNQTTKIIIILSEPNEHPIFFDALNSRRDV